MTRYVLILAIVLFVAWVLAGCGSGATLPPTPTPTRVFRPSFTLSQMDTPTPTRMPAPTSTTIPPVAVATLSPQFWLDASLTPDTVVASMTGNMYEPIGQIGTAHIDGTSFQPLTADKDNWLPLLSPDRKWIVYQSLPHADTPSAKSLSSWRSSSSEIWVTTVDGQQAWQLTDGNAKRSQIAWSSDSQRIAFIEGPNSLLVEIEINSQTRHELTAHAIRPRYRPGSQGVGYVTVDGGLAWYESGITHTIVATSTLPPNTTVHDFDWLSDGQWVIYTLVDKSNQEHPGVPFGFEYSVWVTPIEEFAPTRIANDVHDLEVSPGGRYIAALRGTGYGDVCVIDWHPVFLLLSPDLKSTRLVSAENRAALPSGEQHAAIFTDLYRTSWVNEHVAKVTIFTCQETSDGQSHEVKTHGFLVDLTRQMLTEVGSENPW